jgi:Helicase associated domain
MDQGTSSAKRPARSGSDGDDDDDEKEEDADDEFEDETSEEENDKKPAAKDAKGEAPKKKRRRRRVISTLQESKWQQMYQRLLCYRERHGNCLVPNRFAEDTSLGAWGKYFCQSRPKLR